MSEPQRAYVELSTARLTARAGISVTPAGLMAIGTMVSMILAGSAAIVVAARTPRLRDGRVSARGGSRRSP
ncbi:MAG: hypothetical protein PGN23_16145 [Sphingomonas adhaesiva]|uniref:hypothetical protein n=1 Tax=Sphingomonas adhaesiva TaxID=28212 RepID=UPI002FFD32AB